MQMLDQLDNIYLRAHKGIADQARVRDESGERIYRIGAAPRLTFEYFTSAPNLPTAN